MSPFWHEVLNLSTQALLLCSALMFLLWLIHFALRNAAIVDAGWAAAIAMCSILYCIQGGGGPPRKFLITIMVCIWGGRLSLHLLLNRILGHPEEGRYLELRRKWGANIGLKFLLFYQMQALSCVLLSLPILLACTNDWPDLSWIEKAAAVLFVFAKSGETIADMELNRFKQNPANKGRVCREGLWNWSRHPNYFFEWLIWVSFALYALPAHWGFLGLISPALILHFVLNVTGIPPTEEQALRSKGEEYRQYQREVSAFWPMPPKTI